MKKLNLIIGVLVLTLLASCSNDAERNYALGRLDATIDNSQYFGKNVSILESLSQRVSDVSLRSSLNTRIQLLQRDRQSEITEIKKFISTVKENDSSCGGVWLPIVLTTFILVVIFVVFLATGKITINWRQYTNLWTSRVGFFLL